MDIPNVLVIDAGLGNIGSVVSALEREVCTITRERYPDSCKLTDQFTHIVLPGVGAFRTGMEALKESGWDEWIQDLCGQKGTPLLGICLGMQLLASEGEEGASVGRSIAGLDLIPGQVKRLDIDDSIVLPHVGWNSIQFTSESHLRTGLDDSTDMYFVHSYSFRVSQRKYVLGECVYGKKFVAMVGRNNIFGVQFHPEKSQKTGRKLLQNFLSV